MTPSRGQICGLFMCAYFSVIYCNTVNDTGEDSFIRRVFNNLYPPPQGHDGPVRVKVGMYIESVGRFQSTEMSFDADFYLYMNWLDPNLTHSSDEYMRITDPEVLKMIWVPDLYLANSRNAAFHNILVPNFSLYVDQKGTVAYSGRITATISCNFDLDNYPMDRQICNLRIVSYAYIANKVNITWFDDNPMRYSRNIGLPEFHIESIWSSHCDGTYRYAITEESFNEGPFSCLSVNINLKRSAAYHVVQSYLPSSLIVMISWVSFWIDRRAVHARITLWFTTLLSLFTLHMGVKRCLPESSAIKALDWWFAMCMVLVFCTLTEVALVNIYMRKADKFERMAQCLTREKLSSLQSWSSMSSINSDQEGHTVISRLTISYYAENKENMEEVETPRVKELHIGLEYSRRALDVDLISRFLFPISFSVFNVLYWGYYLWLLG